MASLLEASSAQLEEVRVDTLKDNVYYAVAKVRSSTGLREIDARPSDVLTLAVLTHSPMFVSPDIPEALWITTSKDWRENPQVDQGPDSVMKEIRRNLEQQVAPHQLVAASRVVQEENPKEYLTRMGFLPDDKEELP